MYHHGMNIDYIKAYIPSTIAASIVSIVLGIIYSVVIFDNDMRLLNPIITVGCSVALYSTLNFILKFFKANKQGINILLFCVSVTLFLYFSWVWWLFQVTRYDYIVFQPRHICWLITKTAELGAWEIMEWRPRGWNLYLFWIFETLVILAPIIYKTFMVTITNRDKH